ncbi:hypothetical protein ALC62_14737 [Cyphomyrmex costatus]|uniref:Gustatory receptor n=1 Tax=Cyphomyrmex costatus TaxID=456900 RepID=A0A151K2J4_9HYME|nr:hypothetical protein ALC62_14737 [Cyphomyrmex costatus]
MTKSLQSALAPLFITSSFHNLGLFEYPIGQPRLYSSCLYALAKWSIVMYLYYPVLIYTWQNNFGQFIKFFLTILTVFTSVFVSLYRYKELKVCLHELSIVDDTLEALGAPKKYRVLRKWILRIIIGWNIYSITKFVRTISIVIVLYSFQQISFSYLYDLFIIFYINYVITSSALICGTVLGYTSSRFHQVNNLLRTIYSNIFENNADYRCTMQNRSILVSQRITGAKNRKQYMWIIK